MGLRKLLNNWQEWLFLGYLGGLPLLGVGIYGRERFYFYMGPLFFLFLWYLSGKKTNNVYSNLLLIIQLLLVAMYFLSSIFSLNIGVSYYLLVNFVTVMILLNISCLYIKKIERLFYTVIISSVIFSIIMVLSKFQVITLPIVDLGDNFILQIWGHSSLGLLLVFSIIIVVSKIGIKNYLYFLPILILLSITLYFTDYRSAIISTVCGLTVLKMRNKFTLIIKWFLIIFLAVMLGKIFISVVNNQKPQKTFDGTRLESWREALIGFQRSPIVGNGPSTFSVINRQTRNSTKMFANYAYSSFWQFLSENGLIFTILLFGVVGFSLLYQYKNNNLLFAVSLGAILNTLLDSTWYFPGIFLLSLIFVFWKVPALYGVVTKNNKFFLKLTVFGSLLIFFLGTTIVVSDILYSGGNYRLAIKINPLELRSRLMLIDEDTPQTIKLFKNNAYLYQRLISVNPLPKSEIYFYELFKIDPKNNFNYYYMLLRYYFASNQTQKINYLLELIENNINFDDWTTAETMPMAKMLYHQAKVEWDNGQRETSLRYLDLAARVSHRWSIFYVELAYVYKADGKIDEAKRVLRDECSKNIYSLPDCNDHLEIIDNDNSLPWDEEMVKAVDNISQ